MKIVLFFLLLILSGNTHALDCSSVGGKGAYNHLIYVTYLGQGNYTVTFPKNIENREFTTAKLFIHYKDMTFINDVKIKEKDDELVFSFTAKSDSSFSAKAIIIWKNSNIQCPILAEKKLV
jgi:hypothetical protein